MKFKLLFFGLFFVFFLVGCSQVPGVGTSNKEIISNDGLVVSFSLKKNFLPLIEYELVLRNVGATPVEITRDNIDLFTLEKMQASFEKNVLTQESLDDFYNQLFASSQTLVIGPEQRRVIKGTFQVEDDYYFSSINTELSILLSINYDYKTEVSSNVDLDLLNRKLRSDRLVQAAPVVVENLNLFVRDSQNYRLIFDIKNKGGASLVNLDDYSFFLGTNRLSCTSYGINGDIQQVDVVTISRRYSYLTISCVIPNDFLQQDDIFTTKFFGDFTYNYQLSFSERIVLPRQRQSSFD